MAKMLIVDDEETIRWALGELFMQDGWEVHCALDGDQAAQMVARTSYDYMITDLKMPGRPGVDVIREARRRNPRLGVTVLTGYASVESAIDALRLGAWDYVTKPCSAAILKARIDEFVQQTGHGGARLRPAGPPDAAELKAFAAGEGTQVLCAAPLAEQDCPALLLGELRRMFCDLGFSPARAGELTQSCVEAVAALSCGEGINEARAALLRGRVLVGISRAADPPAELQETLRRLGQQLNVEASLVLGDGACTVVLSEAI